MDTIAANVRIGVVSDTHGHVAYTRAAIRRLEQLDVQLVLHCGDIGSTAIIPLFAAWPTHFVFGNVDSDTTTLRRAIKAANQTCHERFGSVELAGKRIAFLHSDDAKLWRATIASGEWDLVCYGHTHVAEHHLEGSTWVLNPGALYRANPHTLAIVKLPAIEITRLNV